MKTSTRPRRPTHDYMQQAWVVDDLEAAMAHWTRVCGVGPFFVAEHLPLTNLTYRGQAANLDFTIALAQAGRTQIELVAQHCDNRSIFRDLYPKGRCGFHHIAIVCEDYDHDLQHYQACGCPVISSGCFGDLRFAYVDASENAGCIIELLEDKRSIRDHFKMIADAALDWDGRDPVRPAF